MLSDSIPTLTKYIMLYCCVLNLHFKPNIVLTKASMEFENVKMKMNITEVLASQQINSNNSGK